MNNDNKMESSNSTPKRTFKEKCRYFANDPKCRRMGKILFAVIAVILAFHILIVPCVKTIANNTKSIVESAYTNPEDITEGTNSSFSSSKGMTEALDVDNSTPANNRKEIKNIDMEAKTKELKPSLSKLYQLTDEFGGYKNSSNIYEERASVTVKIPQKDVDRFIERVEDFLTITRQSSYSNDVTNEYQDLESRIKALKTEEESLVAILGQTRDINDIIALHDRLANIRDDLDTYESQIKRMDSQVEYTEISISIIQTEKVEPHKDSLGTQIKEKILHSFDVIKVGCEGVIVGIAGNILYLLLIAAIIAICVFIKYFVKFKKAKKQIKNK